jgi:hypothetical protein
MPNRIRDVQTAARRHTSTRNPVQMPSSEIRDLDSVAASHALKKVERPCVSRSVPRNSDRVPSTRATRDRPPRRPPGKLSRGEDARREPEARDRDPGDEVALHRAGGEPLGEERGVRLRSRSSRSRRLRRPPGAAVHEETRARTHHEGRDEYERESCHLERERRRLRGARRLRRALAAEATHRRLRLRLRRSHLGLRRSAHDRRR